MSKPTTKKPPHKWIIRAVSLVLIGLTVLGSVTMVLGDYGTFTIFGFVLIMLWTNVFLGYFIWATYFYNLNYGVSSGVWK